MSAKSLLCLRSERFCGHTFFVIIFANTKNFAIPFLPVNVGPWKIFFLIKSVENLVTPSL